MCSIYLSRFVIIYINIDIRNLKLPISEERERIFIIIIIAVVIRLCSHRASDVITSYHVPTHACSQSQHVLAHPGPAGAAFFVQGTMQHVRFTACDCDRYSWDSC
jgi:hypothetical protein